ncbi:adhesion G protein-coupled receptor B2 isoform X4 [Paramormyrops kingsleyae]|uniref:Adhesion G protein-coupled receptor B2 n=1 Tax=Paramormyrops kingsleyae TaxID=1676925 RepID=A0A3B3QNH2_9TELE|nr:adhesion G protein-coupled receptor B2 isoform X4 [Paramormyrops kingsleyae]
MNTAGRLCLSVLLSLLALAWPTELPGQGPPCSSLAAGVLYGSFSLRDLFPTLAAGCSWTVENPDPTKYSLYFRFNRHAGACLSFQPSVLALDHYLANQTCAVPPPAEQRPPEVVELCRGTGAHTFLQFDKNFVQLCLAGEPEPGEAPVGAETLAFGLVELLLVNNENSSRFTCAVLCRWFEECLHVGRPGERCGLTQTGCACPDVAPPLPLLPATPHNDTASSSSSGFFLETPDSCCVTELHSKNVIAVAPRDVRQDREDEDQKVKTQRPRSADQPGIFQAQTGDPAAESWSLWSVCSLTCGQGWQVRSRSCVSSPYGTLCSGPLRETRLCNNSATCPGEPPRQAVHGLWEEWSPWSLCSATCGRGSRTRTRSCVAPQQGGKACDGSDHQSKLCNIAVCPVEGQWLDWSPWSRCSVTCDTGTQQRQRRCSVSVHSWAECKGAHSETHECINPECGSDGKWGPWNQWSVCSKTCDSGWQRRYRMCQGTGVQGYPCDGSGEEGRACNDRKCPAPHEICKDEYLVSMTWRRASAGETVYNKCPSNATGSASRRCLLDANGVAYWGPPSFARCVSLEYRYLHLSLREHLAKGQRTLAGEGMSQIVRSLLELMSRKNYYSGDLLFSVEILRNVTDTFKRATYIPAPDDVQKFFQVVSYMLDIENREKWEDAHQVSPGSALLMRVVEDFIHLVGEAQKAFQSSLFSTNNLMITIQREPVSAVSSDINFPMKGRRGVKDWARYSEDKLFIPKEVFTLSSEESDDTSYFVIGAILYRTLGLILPAPESPLVINSKILTVTVRPLPKPTEPMVVVELSPLLNGTSEPHCVVWDYSNLEAGVNAWDTEGCQTLPSPAVHTKCLCSKISSFAVLAQLPKDQEVGPSSMPSVPLMVGCGISFTALLVLLLIYAVFWRYIRSERSIILVNFCLSILASNVLILVGQAQTLSKGLCAMTAAFLHFFFLASFCWVLTEAWQSYMAVTGKMRSRLIRKRFLCLGWGLPALVVAVSVGFTRARGYGTPNYCWLSLEGGLLYAFVGPAAVIVLVNMLIGIVVFNKLMARDGISDKSKKQRAGASLWSSCVVLPLLALTWMSAVLAITDRRSTLFQVLFAVFDSVQGLVVITVHCALRREVQDAVRCRMGVCKDDSENSPDSCKNGQVQIMTDFEKDVDLACQTERGHPFIFKEVNTCNPATITGTLSRISLDDEDDPKLAAHREGGVNFSSLPGNIPPPNLLVQVQPLGGLNELSDQSLKKEVNVEQQHQRGAPVYLCTESGLGWAKPPEAGGAGEGDYMVLPRRTVTLKPPLAKDEGKSLNITVDDPPFPPPPSPLALRPAESEAYPDFASVDRISTGLNRSYGTLKQLPAHALQFQQRPSVRQILASGTVERTRTLPRNLGSTNTNTSLSAGSLERKRVRYSELDFEKVMHTRKRHSELYHEINHSTKFHTIDRYSREPARSTFKGTEPQRKNLWDYPVANQIVHQQREKRWSISSAGGEKNSSSNKPEDQHSWDCLKIMAYDHSSRPADQKDRLELHNKNWDVPSANTPDTSEGDFQTEV